MRRYRNLAGVLVAVGVLIGSWLAGLFPDFGSGDGSGGNGAAPPAASGTPSASEEVPAADVNVSVQPAAARTESGAPSGVLEVVIDERRLLVRRGNGYRPIELDALVELAAAAPGDDDGVKVRIARKASSRALTEVELRDKLREAGLSEPAVFWVPEPVE